MLRDRGTIKWTSLMLPEHVTMLKDLWEQDNIPRRPTLDAQEKERLDEVLQRAVHIDTPLCISVYDHDHIVQKTGVITAVDTTSKALILSTPTGGRQTIAIKDVLDAAFI